jgi:hypothetical protein
MGGDGGDYGGVGGRSVLGFYERAALRGACSRLLPHSTKPLSFLEYQTLLERPRDVGVEGFQQSYETPMRLERVLKMTAQKSVRYQQLVEFL